MTEENTLVTRERVMAPPDRYLNVSDGELVSYFQSRFLEKLLSKNAWKE